MIWNPTLQTDPLVSDYRWEAIMWNQTDVRLVPNQSENGQCKLNRFDLIRYRKYFSVCRCVFAHEVSQLLSFFFKVINLTWSFRQEVLSARSVTPSDPHKTTPLPPFDLISARTDKAMSSGRYVVAGLWYLINNNYIWYDYKNVLNKFFKLYRLFVFCVLCKNVLMWQ